ncbi:MAG: NAD(P)-binding protein [Pseudomonadales bacterium]|nr:NAD(P)-binding protein [Pseudomonadales bacterium]
MGLNNKPPFIYRGGGMMMHPPFQQEDSLLFGFFLKGDLNKLQATCDQCLNAVARGKYRFKPLTNYVMVTFTRINKDYSTHPEDRKKGWGKEIDTSIWIPVGQYVTIDGEEKLDRIHWFTPYIWVDHPMTVLNGREIFGYPKYMAKFDMPESPKHAEWFSMDVNAFKTYSENSKAGYHRLLEVKRDKTPDTIEEDIEEWESAFDFVKGIFKGMLKLGDIFNEDVNLLEQILDGIESPYLPQLFLKQFPDGTGNHAVYQALTTSPARINGFHGAGPLLGEYELTLHEFASEPIAQDLGLEIGTQPVPFGFWVHFDFAIEPPEELVNNSVVDKEKIAILGGGVSAMTAAFALTSEPDWQSKYDVTLYQMGWRVGGKGASGRNAKDHQRIEEHGLHIWFGFYENAFKVMRDAYGELNRPKGAPLATWDEAFKPHSFVVVEEWINNEWKTWPFDFPIKPGIPGDHREALSLWQIAQTIIAWIKKGLEDLVEAITGLDMETDPDPKPSGFAGFMDRVLDRIEEPFEAITNQGLKLIQSMIKMIDLPDEVFDPEQSNFFIESLQQLRNWLNHLVNEFLEDHDDIRRLYILIDLGVTAMVGFCVDDLYDKGFDSINDLDFREWLVKHGANETITANSAPVRAVYDLVFSYIDGDINNPSFEAGTCLQGALRMVFCYEGGIMWKMQAGMGDVVFTPLYQVLKKRGVKFKYFHKVESLLPDANDPQKVAEIKMTQQVELNEGEDQYHPFVYVKGLACWPSEPLYDQIVPEQAALLQDNQINLESSWSNWPKVYQNHYGKPLPEVSLKAGKDFDKVIFGLSLASVPVVCEQLLPLSPKLKACVDNVNTVVTQAYQVWQTPDLEGIGWSPIPESGEEPVLTSFTEPVDTWASMSQLIEREVWPSDEVAPKNVSYFCGVQNISEFPPFSDHGFPKRCADQVKASAINQLNEDIEALWKNAKAPGGGFKWEWLIDANNGVGEQRFDAQYWRSNIDPSERYVQTSAGTSKYRLDTDESGFNNLYITGDWIKNGINAGCVEAATQAGLQTSRAICGYPKVIKGEHQFQKPEE